VPGCKDTPNARPFARAVNDIQSHLFDRRKVQMQMRGYRLLDGEQTSYACWEASTDDVWPA
jgi:hypothetical protein